MTLSQQEFNQLRDKGLSMEQITSFESGNKPDGVENKPTFGSMMKESLQETKTQIGDAINRNKQGEQGILPTAATVGIQSLGTINDVIGNLLRTFDQATPQFIKDLPRQLTPDFIEKAVDKAVGGASNFATSKMAEIEATSPKAAQALRDSGELLMLYLLAQGGGKTIKPTSLIDDITKKGISSVDDLAKQGVSTLDDVTKQGISTTDDLLKQVGQTKPGLAGKIGEALPKAVETASGVGKFATAQLSGLSPKTIETILKNPYAFEAAQKAGLTSLTLGNRVKTAIKTRLDDLSTIGTKYNTIRQSTDVVKLPNGGVRSIFNKHNIALDVDGLIVTSPESIALTLADKKALQSFIDTFGNTTELSANAFLNARKSLSNLSAFESGKSSASTFLAKDLRKFYDNAGKDQLKGLKELDAQYAPEIQQLTQIRKEYLTTAGELKDGALSKLAKLTGNNKDLVLSRLEAVVPGISEEINILSALSDVQAIQGAKVGTYLRSASVGAAGGLLLSGGNPVVAVITALASTPQFIVPIIKEFAKIKLMGGNFIDDLIKHMKAGKKLSSRENLYVKNAIREYSKNINLA